jgi:hypothetical protein
VTVLPLREIEVEDGSAIFDIILCSDSAMEARGLMPIPYRDWSPAVLSLSFGIGHGDFKLAHERDAVHQSCAFSER